MNTEDWKGEHLIRAPKIDRTSEVDETASRLSAIREGLAKGVRISKIAKQLGISFHNAARIAREAGLQTLKKGR